MLLSLTFANGQEAADSLLIKRSSIYYQYLDIKNNTSNFEAGDYKKLSELLESLVQYDNQIIDSLESARNRNIILQHSLGIGDNEGLDVSEGSSHGSPILWTISILLLILLIVATSILGSKAKQYRNRLQQAMLELKDISSTKEESQQEQEQLQQKIGSLEAQRQTLQKEKEGLMKQLQETITSSGQLQHERSAREKEMETEISSLQNKILNLEAQNGENQKAHADQELHWRKENLQCEQRITELEINITSIKSKSEQLQHSCEEAEKAINLKEQQIDELKNEIAQLEGRIKTADIEIEEFRKRTAHDNDYYKKLSEMDLNMIKMEKLERLKKQQMISEEEYLSLKQKYLGSL